MIFFCWQHCLRLLNSGNTASYPYTHSNAQESHFSCRYSQEARRFAGSNNSKRLALNGLSIVSKNRNMVVNSSFSEFMNICTNLDLFFVQVSVKTNNGMEECEICFLNMPSAVSTLYLLAFFSHK